MPAGREQGEGVEGGKEAGRQAGIVYIKRK